MRHRAKILCAALLSRDLKEFKLPLIKVEEHQNEKGTYVNIITQGDINVIKFIDYLVQKERISVAKMLSRIKILKGEHNNGM